MKIILTHDYLKLKQLKSITLSFTHLNASYQVCILSISNNLFFLYILVRSSFESRKSTLFRNHSDISDLWFKNLYYKICINKSEMTEWLRNKVDFLLSKDDLTKMYKKNRLFEIESMQTWYDALRCVKLKVMLFSCFSFK